MTENNIKAELSYAYLHAVAARASFGCESSGRHSDSAGVDAYLRIKERLAQAGVRHVRFHDLRHTFGRRLRAAGVSFEDRQDLLGHRSTRVTTDYSAAELGNLLNAANRITESRKSPAMTVLRLTG